MGSKMRGIAGVQAKDHKSQREIIVIGIERKERTPANLGT